MNSFANFLANSEGPNNTLLRFCAAEYCPLYIKWSEEFQRDEEKKLVSKQATYAGKRGESFEGHKYGPFWLRYSKGGEIDPIYGVMSKRQRYANTAIINALEAN